MFKLIHEDDTDLIIPRRLRKFIKTMNVPYDHRAIIEDVIEKGVDITDTSENLQMILDVFKPDIFLGNVVLFSNRNCYDNGLVFILGPKMLPNDRGIDFIMSELQKLMNILKDYKEIYDIYKFTGEHQEQMITVYNEYFWPLFLEDLRESGMVSKIIDSVEDSISEKIWVLYNAIYPVIHDLYQN